MICNIRHDVLEASIRSLFVQRLVFSQSLVKTRTLYVSYTKQYLNLQNGPFCGLMVLQLILLKKLVQVFITSMFGMPFLYVSSHVTPSLLSPWTYVDEYVNTNISGWVCSCYSPFVTYQRRIYHVTQQIK